jgi:hypothetical protein
MDGYFTVPAWLLHVLAKLVTIAADLRAEGCKFESRKGRLAHVAQAVLLLQSVCLLLYFNAVKEIGIGFG